MNSKIKKSILGIMTGMSMDGIDLAHVDISGNFPHIELDFIGSHSVSYDQKTKEYMQSLKSPSIETLAIANIKVAELISDCINDYLLKNNLKAVSIDAIASHGQAIYHSDKEPKTTLQIGSPSIIAENTSITCIGNFRMRDIAGGGTGAPYAPILDQFLMKDESNPVGVINLGSISNISVIHHGKCKVGFDMGPANLWVDYLSKKAPLNHSGIDYDGSLSSKGKVLPSLLNQWKKNEYLTRIPPKSAGYQDFSTKTVEAEIGNHSLNDLIRTSIEFSAYCIQTAIRQIAETTPLQKIYLCGGGVYNPTLTKSIKDNLSGVEVLSINNTHGKEFNDNKEAVLFALLGYLTTQKQSAASFLTTGSKTNGVYGEIALGDSLTI